MSGDKEHQLFNFPPSEIAEDHARFQSRAEYPRDARDSDMTDLQGFDVHSAEVVSLWRDPYDNVAYVIDGHRRVRLAKRLEVPLLLVQFLEEETDADAFARGVDLNIAQWAFERGDKLLWAMASRRAAVERALHTGWLLPDGVAAIRLYKYFPDLGRRYSSFPNDYREVAKV